MTVRMHPISRKVILAHITRTYMADGGGKKKGKKGKKAVSTERNTTCRLTSLNSSNRPPPRSL
jgi:hypothetical protein